MSQVSLEDILGDFSVKAASEKKAPGREALTIWVRPELRARYNQLQKASQREFGHKVRKAVEALIELAEARAS